MNRTTGREFSFTNPQDDPHLYPQPPAGFSYDLDGTLKAEPRHLPYTLPHNRNNTFPSRPPINAFDNIRREPINFGWQPISIISLLPQMSEPNHSARPAVEIIPESKQSDKTEKD